MVDTTIRATSRACEGKEGSGHGGANLSLRVFNLVARRVPNGRGPVSRFYRDFFNPFSRLCFLARFGLPKPDESLLEFVKSAHLPAVKVAEERKKASAMMRVG